MAATGLFTTGFTEAEVLAIQAKAKADLLAGRVVMSYSDSGTSVTKAAPMPVKDVLEECAYALRILNPVVYARKNYLVVDHRIGGGL